MTGRDGGLWFFKDERLPAVKPWVEPPPATRWERMRHQRAWGWAALLAALLFAWLAVTTRGVQVVIPASAIRWSLAAFVCPGLGQVLAGSLKWGAFWFMSFVFWAVMSLFLVVTLKRGGSVTTVTLFESFLAMGLSWFLSVLQAFHWGLRSDVLSDPGSKSKAK
jgi:hypothetical protein